jgi:hypothetical protein
MFLNANGFSASAAALYCMKVVTSWLIWHWATCYMQGFRFSWLLSLRRRPSLQFYSVQCSFPCVSEKNTASIFRMTEFGWHRCFNKLNKLHDTKTQKMTVIGSVFCLFENGDVHGRDTNGDVHGRDTNGDVHGRDTTCWQVLRFTSSWKFWLYSLR